MDQCNVSKYYEFSIEHYPTLKEFQKFERYDFKSSNDYKSRLSEAVVKLKFDFPYFGKTIDTLTISQRQNFQVTFGKDLKSKICLGIAFVPSIGSKLAISSSSSQSTVIKWVSKTFDISLVLHAGGTIKWLIKRLSMPGKKAHLTVRVIMD